MYSIPVWTLGNGTSGLTAELHHWERKVWETSAKKTVVQRVNSTSFRDIYWQPSSPFVFISPPINSVKITPEGRKALVQLSKGDMRRALNILQACHAGYEIVDEDAVYNCTGNPHPADIETIVSGMLTDDFTTAYSSNVLFSLVFSRYRNNYLKICLKFLNRCFLCCPMLFLLILLNRYFILEDNQGHGIAGYFDRGL